MAKQPINKHFVSSIDKKIREFDQNHTPSADQQAEIEKYRHIYSLRDNPAPPSSKKEDIWK